MLITGLNSKLLISLFSIYMLSFQQLFSNFWQLCLVQPNGLQSNQAFLDQSAVGRVLELSERQKMNDPS